VTEDEVVQTISDMAAPLDESSLSKLLAQAGQAKYILLGEASHGTSEYYTLRARLSRQLLEEHGFRFIAVEGDWPACYALNRYVKGYPDAGANAKEAMKAFSRWPSWMWANEEIAELAEWLRKYNADKPSAEKAGFYGMDVYSLWESLEELLRYAGSKDQNDLPAVKKAFECFEPHNRSEQAYGISAALYGEGCEDEAVEMLSRLHDKWKGADQAPEDREQAFSAELNAMAVKGAEAYYRTMIRHDAESWNVRDTHMVDVLKKLMEFHGEGAKCIVWAHNTHVGDARATDMVEDGMINIGQLLREKYGGDVFAVGLGSYQGTVIAGSEWGSPYERLTVPPAIRGSWEELLHRSGAEDKLLLFGQRESWLEEAPIGHRAIGVVYHPRRERGNYVPTAIAKRYDAFLYVDRTQALSPLAQERVEITSLNSG
jgi:erythromycin esterase-like protein